MTTKTNDTNPDPASDTQNPYGELIRLCRAHAGAVEELDRLVDELEASARKIINRRIRGLRTRVAETNTTREALLLELAGCPELFAKPRSRQFNGVKIGYRKEKDRLNFNEAATIRLIRENLEGQADTLIKTSESVVVDAVANLSDPARGLIGVGVIAGKDKPFVSGGSTDLSKLVSAMISKVVKGAQANDADA